MTWRLSYNSIDIDFGIGPRTFEPQQEVPVVERSNTAISGARDVAVVRTDAELSFEWPVLVDQWRQPDDEAVFRIRNFLFWARTGGAFTLARDKDETISTTLNGAVSAGDQTLTLTSGTGVAAGKNYVLRTQTGYELVRVDSVNSNTVSLRDTLISGFADAATFRSDYYWSLYLPSRDSARLVDRFPFRGFVLNAMEKLT